MNKAAVITEGDLRPDDGSVAKPWNLCTIQQVEDFKALIRIFPLWSSSIFLSTPIAIQSSLTILQTLTMNRHIGSNFKIPAGSMLVIVMISTSISLALIDRCLYPLWKKLTKKYPTPLQRIGLGHILNILSMTISALVELKRHSVVHNHNLQKNANSEVPMSVLWLFPQLVLVGIGEAFHFPGQVTLYYQEFPMSLKSTATAMVAVIIGIAYYLSTAVIDLFRRVTGWLPDDVNKGRLDKVYWVIVLFGVLNFGYYVVCAKFYEYQHVEHKRMVIGNSGSSDT